LRTAFKGFVKAGVTDTSAALQDVFSQIKNAPDDLTAAGIAIDQFGGKAGPQLVDAIRSGKLEYGDLLKLVQDGKETILENAASTYDLSEQWQIFKNRLTVAVLPIATRLFSFINEKA